MPERDVAELSERAWKQIDHALKTGVLVTEAGIELPLKPGEYARLIQYVASLDSTKKPKLIPLPEDARLGQTGR